MLGVLRSIVQEVDAAKDLKSALGVVVERVQDSLKTSACAIYLFDAEQDRLVLRAVDGLKRDAIDNVSLKASEGLVGLVCSRAEPINLENAAEHKNFQYFPEIGEEAYSSFLGVPIVHHRNVLGVMLVQSMERRRFDEEIEAFMITLASQLAVVLAHAKATGSITEISSEGGRSPVHFDGAPGAPGVAVGTAVVVFPLADLNSVPDRPVENVEKEIKLFHAAVDKVKSDIERASAKFSSKLGVEERGLFDVYLNILNDNALGGEVMAKIRDGQWVQGALREVIGAHVQVFEMMDDAYLRERAADIRDLGRRILSYLQGLQHEVRKFPDQVVLVGEELTPANLGEVPRDKLVGLISLRGSKNSHVAILARAMEIPTVVGASDIPYRKLEGMEIIIDGYQGKVFPNPSQELRDRFNEVLAEEKLMVRGFEALSELPSETLDKHRFPLRVNTGLLSDVAKSILRGAEGVGLYRTEVPFMMTDRFPSEKQQEDIYRQHLVAFSPNPVTMRTLDVGGDKELPYFPINEDNPFLGWRGIRITLDHPEIFLVQVRAMLKASQGLDNLRIMLPMISNVTEVEEALQYIHRAYHEIREEGYDVIMPAVGVMIEVPAAVYQARELAQRVDFLSVGSNDLTQYLLAVDRNNSYVADLYHSYHPAVLKALKSVVNKAHLENKPVSVCGELAGEPGGALLLMAMGYDELSMSASNILRVKSAIRHVTLKQAKQLLEEVMTIDSAPLVELHLNAALKEMGIEHMETSL
ncbi:MAG: phosphoenolpyruvate--protein phosphotransferase [Pseudomonadales bacterium]